MTIRRRTQSANSADQNGPVLTPNNWSLIPVRDARQSYPPFDAIFSPFKHGSIRYGRTASAADRAVLVELRRFLAVIHTICTLPVSQTGAMLFFQLINRRYERASTVLTSNKGFEEWGQILGDEVMAAALIDRLLHHCHIVNIRGSSYRMRKHTDLSKILHSPPAESSPSTPKRKRARPKEKTTI